MSMSKVERFQQCVSGCGAGPGVLLLVGVGLLLPAGCRRDANPQAQMPARPPAHVTVATAVTRDVPVYLDEIGRILPIQTVAIVPQVGGKIIAAHIQDGAQVAKGDLLFEIDPRPFEAALALAKASLAQNKAELELAQAELARMAGAVASLAVSQMQFDQKKNAVAVAEARVAAAEAAVDAAKLNLEYTKIYSPLDGRAGALLIHPGNIARENAAPLLVIQQMDPIYAEFTVTENDLGTVRKFAASRGQEFSESIAQRLRVEVDVPGDSTRVLTALGTPGPSSQPGSGGAGPREGKLTFMDNTVQSTSGTVRLRASVPNADRYFWPGQFVNVRLVLTTKVSAVLIPAQAQQIGQQGAYVYVVTPDQTAEHRPIVPGQRQADLIVVESGLKAGEQVIVTGQMLVMPGGPVVVTNRDGFVPNAPANATASARGQSEDKSARP